MTGDKNKLPPPVLLSAIACDTVIIDARTKKSTLVGIFENINASKYPARHGRLAFFFELTNGHGKTEITVKLVDVQKTDEILYEWTVEIKFKDVRQIVNSTFDIGGIQFPRAGEYRFQIFCGTELLGERRIIFREIQIPSGGQ